VPRWSALPLASLALAAACGPARSPNATERGAASGAPSGSVASALKSDPSRPARTLVFRAPGFPTVDAPPIDDATLERALAGLDAVRATSPTELEERLRDADVLVLPYGSAFPIDAWPRIQSFLHDGGGLAVLGGAPFHEPVRWEAGTWIKGPRQTEFAHSLLVGPADPITIGADWKPSDAPAKLAGFGAAMPPSKTTWALTLRLTNEREFPDEHGSAGPRDAVARPLAHVVDAEGTPRACPLIEIDRLRGPSSGARWVFATTDAKLDAPVVRAIVTRAIAGASEIRVLPRMASIAPSSKAELDVTVRSGRRDAGPSSLRAQVFDASGATIVAKEIALSASREPGTKTGTLVVDAPAAPGSYRVVVSDVRPQPSDAPHTAETAFWVRDDRLLASAPKITVSGDWLRKDGKTFPIIGTTYMASDVHRHFLFEPNPRAWEEDFAAMQRRGINFVRTGLWTAWSRVMSEPGKVDERVLAALEAWVQTAARHDIVVCFDFFAFLPPAYGGSNPYLDPKSLEGQKAFVSAFARRFAGVGWIHWDLINEPSYAPRAKLWQTRPIGDPHEAAAWRAWVAKRHGTNEAKLRAIWNEPGPDVWAVPRDEDFVQTAMQIDRRPRKARDFRELAEEIVTEWARTLRTTIREAGKNPLVTLGQDEGGIHERATQQLMSDALDYTAVHTWWRNDDLMWDGVVTKVLGKPNIHQETGIMRLEDIAGTPWRTPADESLLLDRKLGYTFAGRGAGVVEWVWNVNSYMPLDMESTIGIFRPDGTAKPELDALVRYARFFAEAAKHLDDFEPEPVVLVLPHARAFLGRSGAIDATRHVVRALTERFGIAPAAVSDLRLSAERLRGVKLVLVPSPEVLDERASTALLEAAKAGTKVLVTGSIDGDSYGRDTPSLKALELLEPSRPLAMTEKTGWAGSGWVPFQSSGQSSWSGLEVYAQETLRRAETPSLGRLAPKAGTTVWHEPLPLEWARDREPLIKMLGAALAAAKVPVSPGSDGVVSRVLLAPRAALLAVVNERPEAASRRLIVDGRAIDVPVAARSSTMLVVERPSGKPLVTMPPL
jgi:hypothetical protein